MKKKTKVLLLTTDDNFRLVVEEIVGSNYDLEIVRTYDGAITRILQNGFGVIIVDATDRKSSKDIQNLAETAGKNVISVRRDVDSLKKVRSEHGHIVWTLPKVCMKSHLIQCLTEHDVFGEPDKMKALDSMVKQISKSHSKPTLKASVLNFLHSAVKI